MKKELRYIIHKGFHSVSGDSQRSKKAVKNIIVSIFTKGISIITSFLIVPLTIRYVNPTQYGVWLTISSVIAWITYFNLGLGNGFRNKYAEAKANNDIECQQEYVSTTYFSTFVLVMILFVISSILNSFIQWSSFLKLDYAYNDELKIVFTIVSFFFCFNMSVNTFSYLLLADQRPGLLSVIQVTGQVVSLIVIYVLTKITSGSLTNLASYYSGIPAIVMLLASLVYFRTDYFKVRPRLKCVRPKLVKNILTLGLQFFFINICLILIFQVINIIITRELGPDTVTEYNIAYKYFHILYMVMVIIITPFWSAFTDAYAQKDYSWMKKTLKSLEYIWFFSVLIGVVMLLISAWFYKFWLKDEVSVSYALSASLLIYMLMQTLGAIYMHLINGIGTIRLQLYIYLLFAIISWPLITWSCRVFGVCGAVIMPTLVYLVQAILGKIQLSKLLSDNAKGLWNK